MAQIKAIASGSVHVPANWDGGVVPQAGDIAYSNGFTMEIDADWEVDGCRTSASTGIVAGGVFKVTQDCTLTTIGLSQGVYSVTPAILIENDVEVTIYNLATNSTNPGVAASNVYVLSVTAGAADVTIIGETRIGNNGITFIGTCTITHIGDFIAFPSTNLQGLLFQGGGVFNLVGDAYSRGVQAQFMSKTGAGTFNITGDIRGGEGLPSSRGVTNTGSGNINVTGDVMGNLGYGISSSSGEVRIAGDIYAGNDNGIKGTGLFVLLGGTLTNAGNVQAAYCSALRAGVGAAITWNLIDELSGTFPLYSSAPGLNASDLRAGVTVGATTGTLAVPPKAAVALGVPTDDTVGTLSLVATVDSAAAGLAAAEYLTPQVLAAITTP